MNASAVSGDAYTVERYEVDMTLQTDRRIQVVEYVTVRFLTEYYNGNKITMFYRSLPTDGGRYYNIEAACPENADFHYNVKDNPDISGFIDVNCVGGVAKGQVWTYKITYAMESTFDSGDGMIIDVIPFGFTVPLYNVTARLHFPTAIAEEDYTTYVGFGSTQPNVGIAHALSLDGKTLILTADSLGVHYNDDYEEWVADGVTVDFRLPEGTLVPFAKTQYGTKDVWWIVLFGALAMAIAFVVKTLLTHRREMVTVVNLKAPDEMDPMAMGKLLDGNVDSEDVTSMIYYFAHKGYLAIDLEDEDDPVLIKKTEIPNSEKIHARTLFNGLFKSGERVSVSDLQYSFYEEVDKAKKQVKPITMYEGKSILSFLSGSLIAVLYAFLVPFIMSGKNVGGGYFTALGAVFAFPALVILVLAFVRENYRYKWRARGRKGMFFALLVIAGMGTLIFTAFFVTHVMTSWEKFLLSLFAFGCMFMTLNGLTRTETYAKQLGEVLGFKDFIVVTEEERIKFMLEENPQLYYKILPYAQVLGVTDEWEEKFASITLAPPEWCTGTDMTLFDYWMIKRCMTRAMVTAMARPNNQGGGLGRSGGGGGFGGFGGGGFGGGGGGVR